MFGTLKLLKLASALKQGSNSPQAYSAVAELGQIGSEKAVELLIRCLPRQDGVARSAARELGRLGNDRALQPLVQALSNPHVSQSAAEALSRFGSKAIAGLTAALKEASAEARRAAADALGTIRDKRAVEPLIQLMQADSDYAVRTAAAKALGELKDPRALWVIVGTLKLRDETTPERQAALEKLRQAASAAWRKIGDPLGKGGDPLQMSESALAQQAAAAREMEIHPRLADEIEHASDDDLVGILKELIGASEEVSWAKLENREAMLPAYFRSYEQRRETAEKVGAEWHRRHGAQGLNDLLAGQLGDYAALRNWWQGLKLLA